MSKYKGYTEVNAKAYKKYAAKLAKIQLRMKPELKEKIVKKAAAEGKSVNQYIIDKISEEK